MTKVRLVASTAIVGVGVVCGVMSAQLVPSASGAAETTSTNKATNIVPRIASVPQEYAPHKHTGKPGAKVVNQNNTRYFLDLHEQKPIELNLYTEHSSGQLEVQVEVDPGLMLASSQNSWTFPLEGTQSLTLPITVYGAEEGRHHVNIFITHTDRYGQISSRALAQQVDVGIASTQVQSYHSQAKAVEPYVRLPAHEVIH